LTVAPAMPMLRGALRPIRRRSATMQHDTPVESHDAGRTTHRFEAEVEQVLRLVVHSLYSNKEIFLRELLSNASDALDKLRFRALTEPGLLPGEELRIRIEPDAATRTLRIWDNGVGMTRDELVSNLGTIARSGSRELAEKLRAAGGKVDLQLIGQFGVGFYSAFLVADRVEVISRAAGTDEAWKWSSDARTTFTVEPAQRDVCGTTVILHLAADQLDLLRSWKLEELVRQYSDYLSWPIEIRLEREKADVPEWRRINQGSALWQRSPAELSAAQYEEFYRRLTRDFDKPLAWKHFRVEGTQEFAGLLYIPRHPPFDLFSPDQKRGVRLYVKRVFVMEDCEELLPRWLRFVRGVIDSEDLPLNVSREILQDSRLTKTIRKQVIKHVLELLGEISEQRPDDYALFWRAFGAVLKEGLHYEPDQAPKIAKLLRYESSAAEGLVSLAQYLARKKEGQTAIYYALGESRKQIESSPHLEGLRSRGLEVLYMIDPVDAFAVQGLREYEGVPLVSASSAALDFGAVGAPSSAGAQDVPSPDSPPPDAAGLDALRARCRVRLQERVSEVRESARLVDSPACLVVPEGGPAPYIERLLRATQRDIPFQKRILEINPRHPLIRALAKLVSERPDHPELDGWIDVLFDQALIAEGSPVEDPGRLVRHVTALLTAAAVREAGI
jgi:molecular chaperone HtpG